MTDRLVQLVPRQTFTFTNVAADNSLEHLLIRDLEMSSFGGGTMLTRVHSASIGTDAEVELFVDAVSPTVLAPETQYAHDEPSLRLLLDDSASAPDLRMHSLAPDFGSHLRLRIKGTQPSTAVTVTTELSVDLLLRDAPPDAPLQWESTHHNYVPPDAVRYYIPINSTVEKASVFRYVWWPAPHDGWLERVQLYFAADGGSTTVGLHRNNNSTPDHSVTETAGATTAVAFDFGRDAVFNKGDMLHVSVDPTNSPSHVNVVCTWVYQRNT